MRKSKYAVASGFLAVSLMLVGCGTQSLAVLSPGVTPSSTKSSTQPTTQKQHDKQQGQATTTGTSDQAQNALADVKLVSTINGPDGKLVTADPNSQYVLVNKQISLPQGFVPPNLVVPNIPWLYPVTDERHEMQKVAADALEKLFAGAKQDGIYLDGVSAYRAYDTQVQIYNASVASEGQKLTDQYSAVPGHSEHQTGLAIDVSGSTGKCAADDCFADMPEAKWLAQHAQDYGFIIRYPQGKESITGYAYEAWHIRYVGIPLAKYLTSHGLTLEEYYQNATAVSASQ